MMCAAHIKMSKMEEKRRELETFKPYDDGRMRVTDILTSILISPTSAPIFIDCSSYFMPMLHGCARIQTLSLSFSVLKSK